MQQRSKALAVLAAPWVPAAGAFCAVVERLTRDVKVSENYAKARGWLREYQPYALEGSLPEDLAVDDVGEWAAAVVAREQSAGGVASVCDVQSML